MAEVLLRASLGLGYDVRSAGTGALLGFPPADEVITLMKQHGYDASQHRAQLVSPEMLRWAELVLVMESHHREAVQEMDATVRGKTFLLGHWQEQQPIADPMGQDAVAFERAYAEIVAANDAWLDKLSR